MRTQLCFQCGIVNLSFQFCCGSSSKCCSPLFTTKLKTQSHMIQVICATDTVITLHFTSYQLQYRTKNVQFFLHKTTIRYKNDISLIQTNTADLSASFLVYHNQPVIQQRSSKQPAETAKAVHLSQILPYVQTAVSKH